MQDAVDIELDLCGLTCPLPLLKTKQSLNTLESGQTVRVIATDPGSERDFHVFAQQSGNLLLAFDRQDDKFVYLIRKK